METYLYASPLGQLLISVNEDALKEIDYVAEDFRQENPQKLSPVLRKTLKWLESYFAGENPSLKSLPLKVEGTAFQKIVWQLLQEIPYGQTVTYGFLSEKVKEILGKEKMSAQAIGGAVGRNPLPIVIPCHRVVGSSGSLTGYTGGIDKKIKLLTIEKVTLEIFTLPKEKK